MGNFTQDVATAQQKWGKVTAHPNYKYLNESDKADIRDTFKSQVPGGEAVINQVEGPMRGALENIGRLGVDSIKDAAFSMRISDDTLQQAPDANTATLVAEHQQDVLSRYSPKSLEKMNSVLAATTAKYANVEDNALAKMGAWGGVAWDGVKAVADNPEGAMQLGASSAGFSLVPMGAAIAGGAVAGPVGAATSTMAAATASESGARLNENLIKAAQEQGLDATDPAVIQQLMSSPEFADMQSNALRKGIGTAAVDTGLSILTGGMSSASRAARAVKAELPTNTAGDVLNAAIATRLAKRSAGTKLVDHLKEYGTELLSEPVSEATGQLAADGEIDAGEVLGEAIGAIGMSGPEKTLDTTLYGTKVTGGAVKAAAKVLSAKSETEVEAKKFSDARTEHKYEDKVGEVAQNPEQVVDLLNPESENYNPVKGVDALNLMNRGADATDELKATNFRKAANAYSDFNNRVYDRSDKIVALQAKKDITPEESTELKELLKANKIDRKTLTDIDTSIQGMTRAKLTAVDLFTKLTENPKGSVPNEDLVAELFSSGGAATNHAEAFGSAIDELSKNTQVTEPVKQLTQAAQAFHKARAVVMESVRNKQTGEVHSDVLNGGTGFLGIGNYLTSIGQAVKAGDTTLANKHLNGLKKFADRHKDKAETLKRITLAKAAGVAPTTRDITALRQFEVSRGGKGFDINPTGVAWNNLIDIMAKESTLLNSAVELGTKNIGLKQTAVTEPVVESVTEPVATAVTEPVVEVKATTTEGESAGAANEEVPLPEEPPTVAATKEPVKKVHKATPKSKEQEIHEEFMSKPFKGNPPGSLEKIVKNKNLKKDEQLAIVTKLSAISSLTPTQKKDMAVAKARAARYEKEAAHAQAGYERRVKEVAEAKAKPVEPKVEVKPEVKEPITETKVEEVPTIRATDTTDTTASRITDNPGKKLSKKEIAVSFQQINVFRTFTTPKKTVKGALQFFPNLLGDLKVMFTSNDFTAIEGIFEDGITPEVKDWLKSLSDFHEDFSRHVNNMFIGRDDMFIYNDALQYMRDSEGKIDQGVVSAMSAASYLWLASRAQETVTNNNDEIATILGLPVDTYIPSKYVKMFKNIGTSKNALNKTLGQTIFDLLEVNISPEAPSNFKSLVQTALGQYATLALAEGDYVNTSRVYTGVLADDTVVAPKPFGLKAVTDNITNYFDDSVEETLIIEFPDNNTPIAGVLRTHASQEKRKDKRMAYFYQANESMFKPLQKMNEKAGSSWEQLFKGISQQDRGYSFKPFEFKEGTRFEYGNSGQFATEEQTKNLINNINTPWTASPAFSSIFGFLHEPSIESILGFKDPSTVHSEMKESAEAVNRKHQRDIDSVVTFFNNLKGHPGTPFYIPASIATNGRMHQHGDINPQSSKLHRYLFKAEGFTRSIKLLKSGRKSKTEKDFLEGIALGFDFEAGKVGGIKPALKMLTEFVEDPTIKLAIHELRAIVKECDSTVVNLQQKPEFQDRAIEISEIIAAAVKKGKHNGHSLKSLIEYAKYLNAKDSGLESFETEMVTEIDGIANGIILGVSQLMTNLGKDMLAVLRGGGFIFSKDSSDTGEYLGVSKHHDPYMITGMVWEEILASKTKQYLEDVARTKGKPESIAFKNELSRFNAVKRIMSSSAIRKLIKQPIMTVMYGAGKKSIYNAMTDAVIETIYNDLAKAALLETKDERQAAVDTILRDANIAGNMFGKSAMHAHLSYSPESIRNITMSSKHIKSLASHIAVGHGATLYASIDMTYGEVMRTRGTYNAGYALVSAHYNTCKSLLIGRRTAELIKEGELPVIRTSKGKPVYAELSGTEMAKIDEELKNILPIIKTPAGGTMRVDKNEYEKLFSSTETVKQTIHENAGKKDAHNAAYKSANPTQGNLKTPGVTPSVLNTQNFDGFIANGLYGSDVGCLGCHDGFYVSVVDGDKANKNLNETMLDGLENYHLAQEMQNSILNAINSANKIMSRYGSDATDLLGKNVHALKLHIHNDLVAEDMAHQDIIDTISKEMVETTKQVNITKQALVDNTEKLNQYYRPDKGAINNGVKSVSNAAFTGLDENTTTLIGKALDQLNDLETFNEGIDTIIPLFLKEMGNIAESQGKSTPVSMPKGSPKVAFSSRFRGPATVTALGSASNNSTLSSDPSLYDVQLKINNMNAVDIFDELQAKSHIDTSVSHNTYLKELLGTTLNKVLNPVDLFLREDDSKETHGKYVPISKRIFVSNQEKGSIPTSGALSHNIRMSTGEVYAHEIVHSITHVGLILNRRLRGQVSALYDLAKAHLTYKDFLTDPRIDVTDPMNAFVVAAAQERYDHVFNNQQVTASGKSSHLDEFMATGLTNEHFRKNLLSLSTDIPSFNKAAWSNEIRGGNIQQRLVAIYEKIMDFFLYNYSKEKPAPNVAHELERLAARLGKLDSQRKTALFSNIEKLSAIQTKLTTFVNDWIKDTFKATQPFKRASILTKFVLDQNNAFGQQMRLLRQFIDRLDFGFGRAIAREAKGLTDRVFNLHELLNIRKVTLDQARESMVESVIQRLAITWKKPLTDSEKVSLHKAAIKTDMSSLLDTMSSEEVEHILMNETGLNTAIDELENEMAVDGNLLPYLHYYVRQARSLGFYMAHGRALEPAQFFNPGVIAKLTNTIYGRKLAQADVVKAEAIIDRLATLYAVKFTPQQYKDDFANLIKNDPDGVRTVLELHRNIRDEANKTLFPTGSGKIMKGYVVDITHPEILIEVGTLADKAKFEAQEYTMSAKPLSKDSTDKGPDTYLFVSRAGQRNDITSGIMSLTANKSMGTIKHYARNNSNVDPANLTPQELIDAAAVSAKQVQLDAMFKPLLNKEIPKHIPTHLIPVVDDRGYITAYRYTMPESTKDNILEKHNHYDAVLGRMAGQTIDKRESGLINKKLFVELKAIYDTEFQKRPANFVEISPSSPNPQYREIYYQFPAKAKAQLEEVWGQGEALRVPKDVVDLAFGHRKYSIRETLIKDRKDVQGLERMILDLAQVFFKDKKITRMKQLEDILSDTTKLAKNLVIVKTFTVTVGNAISNFLFTRMRGVPFHKSLKWQLEAWSGAARYQDDARRLSAAEIDLSRNARRKAGISGMSQTQIDSEARVLQDKIRHYKNELARNPVHGVMTAGLLQTIVDDVETNKSSNPYPGIIEGFTNKLSDKLPAPLVKLGKIALITEDTQAYKLLNNAVAMTDFVGRYIMYKHYMEQAAAKGENLDMAHRKSIATVMHQFVNFNLPSHRMLEYGNKVGFVWYSKYFLGIMKPLMQAVGDRPLDALSTLMMANSMGLPNIGNAAPFISKDVMNLFGTPFSSLYSAADELAWMQPFK